MRSKEFISSIKLNINFLDTTQVFIFTKREADATDYPDEGQHFLHFEKSQGKLYCNTKTLIDIKYNIG